VKFWTIGEIVSRVIAKEIEELFSLNLFMALISKLLLPSSVKVRFPDHCFKLSILETSVLFTITAESTGFSITTSAVVDLTSFGAEIIRGALGGPALSPPPSLPPPSSFGEGETIVGVLPDCGKGVEGGIKISKETLSSVIIPVAGSI